LKEILKEKSVDAGLSTLIREAVKKYIKEERKI
jgi:hypothetical protein